MGWVISGEASSHGIVTGDGALVGVHGVSLKSLWPRNEDRASTFG